LLKFPVVCRPDASPLRESSAVGIDDAYRHPVQQTFLFRMQDRPLNIVLTNDAKDVAGGEYFVLYLAAGMRDRGHNVLISPMRGSKLAAVAAERGFETIETPYGTNGREFVAAAMLARSLRGRKADIIHTNSNFDRTAGAIAARALRCICVASVHSCLSIQHNLTHRIRNRRLVHHFLPVGHSTRKIMIETDRIPPERITVLHIGIPENDYAASGEGRARVRAELELDEKQPLIGNIARLVTFKGHKHLLSAMARVLTVFPNARCALADDGELRWDLERRAEELGISHAVHFLGRRRDVADFLSACDIYSQPSLDHGGETFPIAILNAMSAGLPAVASDVGDIRYMISDRETGILVSEKNEDELAEALTGLLTDEVGRLRMGTLARKRFVEKFTLPVMAEKVENIYRSLLEEQSKKNRAYLQ